jgi:hypothetical protein
MSSYHGHGPHADRTLQATVDSRPQMANMLQQGVAAAQDAQPPDDTNGMTPEIRQAIRRAHEPIGPNAHPRAMSALPGMTYPQGVNPGVTFDQVAGRPAIPPGPTDTLSGMVQGATQAVQGAGQPRDSKGQFKETPAQVPISFFGGQPVPEGMAAKYFNPYGLNNPAAGYAADPAMELRGADMLQLENLPSGVARNIFPRNQANMVLPPQTPPTPPTLGLGNQPVPTIGR